MSDTLRFALNLTLVGLTIVFAVLALIAIVVAIVRRLDDRWQVREREMDAARTTHPATIDATTLVIIAAAVTTVIGGRFRVRSIRRIGGRGTGSSWSQQGRAVLMGSHVIHRQPRDSGHAGGNGHSR